MEASTIEELVHTLQPLKDLAKNWDIDIASCLEEYLQDYLQDYEGLAESIQGNDGEQPPSNLNFAQAAVILHNSSSIYSRKVEYLYNLVYKAVDNICCGRNDKNGSAGRGRGNRNGKTTEIDEFFDQQEENDGYLLLDDILPVETPETHSKTRLSGLEGDFNYSLSASRRHSLRRGSLGRSSLGGKSGLSGTVERSLLVRQFSSVNANSSLRLLDTNSYVDPRTGSLLLAAAGTTAVDDDDDDKVAGIAEGTMQVDGKNLAFNQDDDGGFVGGAFDDDDDDGPGFVMADSEEVAAHAEKAGKHVTFAETAADKAKLLPRDDPWQMMDPHSVVEVPASHRALRVGKTIRLPAGVEDVPSVCVTGARTTRVHRMAPEQSKVEVKPVLSLASRSFKASIAETRKNKRSHEDRSFDDEDDAAFSITQIPLQGLAFGDEFAYIAAAAAKRRTAERRALRKQQLEQEQLAVEERRGHTYDDDDDDDGGFPFGDDDDDDFDDGGNGNLGVRSVDDIYGSGGDGSIGVDSGPTFEDLCRAHLLAFAKDAEKYSSETQLSKRVRLWQERLEPILDDEDQRMAFDIHSYSETVISRVEKEVVRVSGDDMEEEDGKEGDVKKVKAVNFQELTRHQAQYEVCRTFMAALNLSNSGNVDLYQDKGSKSIGRAPLLIKLLRTDIERPMETYLAPSAMNEQNAVEAA